MRIRTDIWRFVYHKCIDYWDGRIPTSQQDKNIFWNQPISVFCFTPFGPFGTILLNFLQSCPNFVSSWRVGRDALGNMSIQFGAAHQWHMSHYITTSPSVCVGERMWELLSPLVSSHWAVSRFPIRSHLCANALLCAAAAHSLSSRALSIPSHVHFPMWLFACYCVDKKIRRLTPGTKKLGPSPTVTFSKKSTKKKQMEHCLEFWRFHWQQDELWSM